MVSCHNLPCCARSQSAALNVQPWQASWTCAPLLPACSHGDLCVWVPDLQRCLASLPPAEEDAESDGDEDVYALLNRAVSQAASRQASLAKCWAALSPWPGA